MTGVPGELRYDELGGYWSSVVPPQVGKPIHFARPAPATPDERATCPFCPGHEADCGAETGRRGGARWRARAVRNRWPVTERHEVVVLTPDHDAGVYGLDAPAWHEALDLVAERVAAMPGGEALVFANHGLAAGASLPHAHAQVVGLGPGVATPPAERASCRDDDCAVCRSARGASARAVPAPEGWAAWVPDAPRLTGEVRIAPRTHAGTWDPPGLAGALAGVLGAVHAAVGPVAVNLVVHAWPGGHHHAHVFPRLGEITVYDLGWGVPVCLIDTDEWAARLRGER